METIADYLALEKIRYEDRLDWEFDIESNCWKTQIPPMLLQTLVENGIKHGISRSVKGGIITIQARLIQDMIEIKVINPGHLQGKNISNSGLGLVNSQNRLKILFGSTAQLSLSPLNKNQVLAKLILPYLEE
jgi:LytS/YehU family sensor histidine kinase